MTVWLEKVEGGRVRECTKGILSLVKREKEVKVYTHTY